MSAEAAEIPEGAPVVKRGKKKLILIGVVLLVVLAIVGGGVAFWMKKRAAHAAELAAEEEGGGKAVAEHKVDLAHPPTFLPLDPFVVNLADRDADRYAQIGVTLELESPAFAEQVKVFMPAVRNAILMVIAHKSAKDLLGRAGKEDLADEIMREALRPMGIETETPVRIRPVVAMAPADGEPASASTPSKSSGMVTEAAAAHDAASAPESASAPAPAPAMAAAPGSAAASTPMHAAAATATPGGKPKAHGESASPIHHVHFSSFIIQ